MVSCIANKDTMLLLNFCTNNVIIITMNIATIEYKGGLPMKQSFSVRLKRMLAFVIDWNLIGLPCLLLMTSFFVFFRNSFLGNERLAMTVGVIQIIILLAWFSIFVLRDFIFKGRSVGKRILGLVVRDKNTNEETTNQQKILRNLFFSIYVIDGMILLITGETIGDRVAKTIVVPKNYIDNNAYSNFGYEK